MNVVRCKHVFMSTKYWKKSTFKLLILDIIFVVNNIQINYAMISQNNIIGGVFMYIMGFIKSMFFSLHFSENVVYLRILQYHADFSSPLHTINRYIIFILYRCFQQDLKIIQRSELTRRRQ